ncbi:sensor histidine kinase [Streptomyces sp. TLI_171]|uniref:sensor histidine kinase n=1 Tax=Streptomyces sp. TLI_171 TaxID=1938859 RepID=UPI000C18396D|nr:sensor histidine kinase [Streptomyces sp. TLI_171]RKE23506.1 anti-sigma regulatory factor (Ser/Thr protein kinase) [Streptomyces sp. TLI_171]
MSENSTTRPEAPAQDSGFRHELYPYDGDAQFLDGAMSFINDAHAGSELVLVAVAEPKERMLRTELEGTEAAEGVTFLDTAALGRNPGRLIPAWRDWVSKAAEGNPVRGISESAWNEVSPAESSEFGYHEWLLNLAFAQSPAWWLLCPYDTAVLEPAAIESARRCHPLLLSEGAHGPNHSYLDEPFAFPALAPAVDTPQELFYQRGLLQAVRDHITACGTRHGLDGARLRELLIAASEVAANSIKHGGGRGVLRTWVEGADLICEFHDSGHLQDPLVGRLRPTVDQVGGRGLWLVQQLCDLVQIRSTAEAGTTIRLHTRLLG